MPGVGIEIRAQQPCRLLADECAAVVRLADGLVAGGEIGDDGRAREGVRRARRQRRPEILTDLDRERKGGHGRAAEQQLCAKRRGLTGKRHALRDAGRRGEVAALIKFTVIGNVRFGHKTQKLPAADDGGAVIELAGNGGGQPDERDKLQLTAGVQNVTQRRLGGFLQRLLQKQVAAGVARQPQLREYGKLHAALCRALHRLNGHPGIIGAVRHAQGGGDGAGSDKTVDHGMMSFPF